jgi:asparagine synthase (glutamine-hydrolysing)
MVSTRPVESGIESRMASSLSHRGTVHHAARMLPSGEKGRALFDGHLRNRSVLAARFATWPGLPPPLADSELIRFLHREVGEDFPTLLDGPFALAVFSEDGLLLARDPLGLRPLYYCLRGDTFYFGSEMKALLRAIGETPSLDEESLAERFVLQDHLLAESTYIRGVRRLRPGHSCHVARHGNELRVIVRAQRPDQGAVCDARSEDGLRLIRAVVERNVAEVAATASSLGVLLSGGFDSSVLAALASRHYRGRVKSFTIADDPSFPDAMAARRVAQHLGTEHHEFLVKGTPSLADLRAGLLTYEDVFYRDTLYLLAQRVCGLTDVVLSGSGADLFGMPVLARPRRLGAVLASWRALAERLGPSAGQFRIGCYMAELQRALAADEESAVFHHFTDEYIPSQLLPSTEKALSQVGVEPAFPFADQVLLAIAGTLPAELKYRQEEEKTTLRAAFADSGIPADILSRPKLCSKANMLDTKMALRNLAVQAMTDEEFSRKSRDGLLTTKFQAVCLDLLLETLASDTADPR